jgi:hypothetical protein
VIVDACTTAQALAAAQAFASPPKASTTSAISLAISPVINTISLSKRSSSL